MATFTFTQSDGAIANPDLTYSGREDPEGSVSVVGGRLRKLSRNAYGYSFVTAEGNASDEVSVVVYSNGSPESNGIVFHHLSANDHFNIWIKGGNNQNEVILAAVTSGSPSRITGTVIPNFNANNVYLLRAVFDGSNVQVYVTDLTNETAEAQLIDSAYSHSNSSVKDSGSHGVVLTGVGCEVDDLTITSIADAPVASQSRLTFVSDNNLPDGVVYTRVIDTTNEAVVYSGNITYSEGDATLDLDISTLPENYDVWWIVMDETNELSASVKLRSVGV